MHVDWFLVGLAVVTIPLAAWGYWMVTSGGDVGPEAKDGKSGE